MPKLTDASTSCNDETTIHAIRDLFRAQRLASRTVPTLTIKQRVKSLNTIRALILNNGAAIQKSISNDFGNRSTAETEMLEMIPVLNAIRYTRRNLGAWMRPEARPVDLAFHNDHSHHEPTSRRCQSDHGRLLGRCELRRFSLGARHSHGY
jgi:acyl-CoA reductase-like NAD-dependent aldehyde dehydrogenase